MTDGQGGWLRWFVENFAPTDPFKRYLLQTFFVTCALMHPVLFPIILTNDLAMIEFFDVDSYAAGIGTYTQETLWLDSLKCMTTDQGAPHGLRYPINEASCHLCQDPYLQHVFSEQLKLDYEGTSKALLEYDLEFDANERLRIMSKYKEGDLVDCIKVYQMPEGRTPKFLFKKIKVPFDGTI